MTTTNKRYSYPRVAANRIDVHHAGENLTNMTHMLPMLVHIRLTYASYGQSLYVATFCESSTELYIVTTPEKKGLSTLSTARQLTDP
jgi:hypothetical protein